MYCVLSIIQYYITFNFSPLSDHCAVDGMTRPSSSLVGLLWYNNHCALNSFLNFYPQIIHPTSVQRGIFYPLINTSDHCAMDGMTRPSSSLVGLLWYHNQCVLDSFLSCCSERESILLVYILFYLALLPELQEIVQQLLWLFSS